MDCLDPKPKAWLFREGGSGGFWGLGGGGGGGGGFMGSRYLGNLSLGSLRE